MRHELYVARFYLHRDNFEAAVLRIQYAMRTFAGGPSMREPRRATIDSGLEAEALLLLGEVYLKMHKFDDARESFDGAPPGLPEAARSSCRRPTISRT